MTNYFSLCYIIQNIVYANRYQMVDITYSRPNSL